MILTICFEPVLENRYYVDKLLPRGESLANKKTYNVSGDGLITSQILNRLNIDVFATGFLGGYQGDYISNRFNEVGIHNEFIPIKDDIKSSIIIYQDSHLLTSIIEESPRITREELGSFYELYANILDNYGIITSQGSLPIGMPEDIYFNLIRAANNMNKKFFLKAKGEELKLGLEAGPFMVLLDKEDLEYISKVKLDFEYEIIMVGSSILEKGLEIVCIDLNEKGTIVLTKDKGYRIEIERIDNLPEDKGYMMAGFAFGFYKNYDIETILKFAQASRLAYAIEDDKTRIDMSDIKKFMTKIDINIINY